jgi:hypothetical protein
MAPSALLFAVPSLLNLVFFLVGIIVLATRRHQIGRRPAGLAITGLALLLANSLLLLVLPTVVTRVYTFDGRFGFSTMYAGIVLFTSLVHLGGLLLLVLAVVADRRPQPVAWAAAPAAYGPPASFGPPASADLETKP